MARWFGAGTSILIIIFFIGLGLVIADEMALFYEVPPMLKVLLFLPIAAGGLALVMLIVLIIAWVRRSWRVCVRIYYSLVTLAVLFFVWFFYHWNLLGFKY